MDFNKTADFWTADRRGVLKRWALKLRADNVVDGAFHTFLVDEIERLEGKVRLPDDNELYNQVSRFVGPENDAIAKRHAENPPAKKPRGPARRS